MGVQDAFEHLAETPGGILAVGGGIGDWEGNGREGVGLAARD